VHTELRIGAAYLGSVWRNGLQFTTAIKNQKRVSPNEAAMEGEMHGIVGSTWASRPVTVTYSLPPLD